MFCGNCGTRISDGLRFCPYCGVQIQDIAEERVVPYASRETGFMEEEFTRRGREAAINELERAYDWFSEKQSKYREYDSLSKRLPKMNRVGKRALMIWGCIIASFSLLYLLIIAYTMLSRNSSEGLGIMLALPIVGLLIGAAMIIGFFMLDAKRRKAVHALQQKQTKIAEELTQHYIDFGPCSFGAEYSNPEIINTILNLVRSGRADSVKEGINIMISDLRMDQMTELSRTTAQHAPIIARNSAAAARGSTAAAIFSAANLFLK